ncbi:MAG: glycosyltransferase family 2 protein [Yoonia sp.]|uniref:glycosyltransferase family 2 protein n=1 Tax=Yoonia sp. TaxID=2212373 RepID=UPI00273E346D|nr:glycosyltransferase family 2 protein [Yoonia sp.]MDP5084677.1 glycosyltransferase family 2 protein [Yoonia sp.]MDP5359962.1 glycosyltransferase family 2 protein [Paracoccaceae bacterium]
MTPLTVIILTKNEARHIGRAIASVQEIAARIIVVDSGSVDGTATIAKAAGAEVMHHPWVNHATQFNWALDQIKDDAGWVLRLDADELVTPALAAQIKAGLPDVAGLFIGRRIKFMGQMVRHGGVFPVRIIRLFRNGKGRCEPRWMDEHIVVDGPTAHLAGEIIDDNRNPLDWWVAKHNTYASREVVDVLNHAFGFLPQAAALQGKGGTAAKRWIKLHVYRRLPSGLRAGAYFLYRYVLRLGFLDGPQARAFHVLQGFWYRYLVDAKLAEVRRHMAQTGATPEEAIRALLGIDVREAGSCDAKAAA